LPTALELARGQYRRRQSLVNATAAAGVQMWRQVDPANLSASWSQWLTRLFVIVQGAQMAAAQPADGYVGAVLAAQGIDVVAGGQVVASALAGVASDGRPLESLLLNPVIATKQMISRQLQTEGRIHLDRAMATGQASLEMLLRTQVADAGRVADGVAIAARPKTGYVRMLVGDSCARCAILGGRFYRYSSGFERHPQCDCLQIPSQEDMAGDFTTDPRAAFDEGRIHGLSEADTKAIRDGADMSQVVNAHQGMYVAGGRKYTRTGATRHGLAGMRLNGATRLMPEQIYREATSREDAVRLLHLHGYLV
jgi:hypothetical protein